MGTFSIDTYVKVLERIEGLVAYACSYQPAVYTGWTRDQVRNHLFVSLACGNAQAVFDADTKPRGLCTWRIDHNKKLIDLIGLIGDKELVVTMRRRWKTEYPTYKVRFYRRNKLKLYRTKA